MQPIQVEQRGAFSSPRNRFNSKPHVIFSESARTACLFDSEHIECYCGPSEWSCILSWSIASDFCATAQPECKDLIAKIEDCVDSWSIEAVKFGFNPTAGTLPSECTPVDSLLVILSNRVQNITYLCHFPNVYNKAHNRGTFLHGLVSVAEWIPSRSAEDHAPTSPAASEPSTMLLDATDMQTTSDMPQNLNNSLMSSNGCCGLLAIGFHQGLVGVVASLANRHLASLSTHGYHTDKSKWALAVEKSKLLGMISCGSTDTADGNEIALAYLDASAVRWNEFQYKSVNGRVLVSLPAPSVYVSTLHFIPNTQTLVVGYSFGGWQLWSMRTLTLEFSLRHTAICAPVVQVAFQEPSDDPRYCCYIWVGWQSCTDHATEEPVRAQTKLYQLHYKQRFEEPSTIPGETVYNYQHLVGLSERLSSELFSESMDRKLLENQLLRIQPIRTGVSSSVAVANQSDAAHLVATMWSVCPGVVRVGLFDLDRWYHAQMPTHIRPDNSFFAIFDVPLPGEDATPLSGHLLESSMESFWSRIAARERQLDALCEQLPVMNHSANLCVTSPTTQTMATTTVRQSAPRPVPEVCLRPSAISFSVLMAWFSRENGRIPGGFLQVRFASRQEACLMSLGSVVTPGEKRFSPTDWLSEAWATGLLESPGLDIIEEEDLERVLHLSHQLNDRSVTVSSDAELVGFRLAYGEGLDMALVHTIDELCRDTNSPIGLPGKRARLAGTTTSMSAVERNTTMDRPTALCPAWVLMMNCLLEHGHLSPLKSVEKLAQGHGLTSPTNPRFREYWFWLRFQRLKTRFDQITESLFTPVPGDERIQSRSLIALDKDSLGLGATAYQIQQLALLGQHWFSEPGSGSNLHQKRAGSLKSNSSLWTAVQTYAQYTRLVLFLCRLGLLPQHCSSSVDSDFVNSDESPDAQHKSAATLLLPYSSSHLLYVIGELRERGGLDEDTPLYLSTALLHACLGWGRYASTGDSAPLRVWREQEAMNSKNSSLVPSYPPSRLQSVCALWQLGLSDPSWIRTRFTLLGFILCDATAASAAAGQLTSSQSKPANPNVIAVQLCRHVLSLYAKEFPAVRSMLPTLFTLWLLDRACFKESRALQLKAYVTGTQRNPWDSGRLINLFPNQSTIVNDYLQRHKQSALCHQFIPVKQCSLSSTRSIYHPSSLIPDQDMKLNDFRPVGAPFLALTRFRRTAQKFYNLKETQIPDTTLVKKTEDALRNFFVQFAESCRRVGRLGDLVNLGLTVWEAQTLVDHYLTSGQYDVLFYCLVARKQYKSALCIYNQFLRARYTSTIQRSQTGRLNSRIDGTLALVSKLLSTSLPEFHEDPRDYSSEETDRQPLVNALAHPFVALETSATDCDTPEVVAYRRDSALACPLTAAKPKTLFSRRLTLAQRSMLAMGETASQDSEEHEDEDGEPFQPLDRSPVCKSDLNSERVRTARLLETAKKSSSEFWDTFRELENLQRSCNLSLDFSLVSKSSQLDSSRDVGTGSSLSNDRSTTKYSELFKKTGKDPFLKLIYTPPTSQRRKKPGSGQLVSPKLPVISTKRSYRSSHEDHHTPISILKCSIPRTPSSELPDQSLNETLTCDDDVKLNLSTVRPSFLPASTLNAAPIITGNEFTFSAPRRISARPKLDTMRSAATDANLSFEFATPLNPHTKLPKSPDLDQNTTDSNVNKKSETSEPESQLEIAKSSRDIFSPTKNDELIKFEVPTKHENTNYLLSPRKPLAACRGPAQTASHSDQNDEQNVSVTRQNHSPPERQIISSRRTERHHRQVEEKPSSTIGDDDSMDLDDTASITSSMSQDNEVSSFSSETPRRSARRVKPPKRYDASAFK